MISCQVLSNTKYTLSLVKGSEKPDVQTACTTLPAANCLDAALCYGFSVERDASEINAFD